MQNTKRNNAVLIITVLVFEILITALLIYSIFSFNIFIIAHIVCIISILLILILDIRKKRISEILFFLIILTSIMGLLGPLMVLIIIIINKNISKDSKNVIDNIKEIMNEDYYSKSETLYNRLTFIKGSVSEYTNSEPFIDIMKYGSFYEKQQVLILVKRYFRPEFADILFNSLKNEDNSIRVEAASLVSSLEKEASDKLKALKMIQIKSSNILSLGTKYLSFYEYYIETDILVNSEYSRTFFDQILEKLKEQEGNGKNNFHIYVLLSKILFKLKRYTEVIETISTKVEFEDIINDSKTLELYMASLYFKKQFSTIRCLAKKALSRKQVDKHEDENIMSIMKYWAK